MSDPNALSADNKALSLTARKNVRDNEEAKKKELKEIDAITGQSGWTFDFEGDLLGFMNAIDPGMLSPLSRFFHSPLEFCFGSYCFVISSSSQTSWLMKGI